MGIAAYNRGTILIARQIGEARPDHNSAVVQSINELPRGGSKLFGETVIRLLPGGRRWCLMNREDLGFSSYGYEYESLRKLFANWDCYVVGFGCDEHSFFYRVR